MKSSHKFLMMGALAGGLAWILSKARESQSGQSQMGDQMGDRQPASDAGMNASTDDVPTVQPTQDTGGDGMSHRYDDEIAPGAPM